MIKPLGRALGLVMLLVLVGCGPKEPPKPLATQVEKFNFSSSILVVHPKDFMKDGKPVLGTGELVAEALINGLRRRGAKVEVRETPMNLTEAHSEAQSAGVEYFALGHILSWDDREEFLSQPHDHIRIQLGIYRTSDRLVVAADQLYRRPIGPFSQGRPERLLDETVEAFLNGLQ